MDDIAADLDILQATPGRLDALLRGLGRSLALWTPAPGKWSITEIVAHLRDMERHAYQARYRKILAEPGPFLPDIDGDALALESDYRSLKLADLVREWRQAREENLALLRTVHGNAWQRTGTHETAGPLTVATLLRRHARGNDEAHLGQIAGIKQRFALLRTLETGPRLLREALSTVPARRLRRRTPQDKWSPLEQACHMRDLESVFVERIARAAQQDRPTFWMPDNDRLATVLRYAEADPRDVVREFTRRRALTLTLLRALPPAAWQRTGLHPQRGEISIAQIVDILAEHDRKHLARVREAG